MNRLCTWLRFDQHTVGKGFCIGGEAEERAESSVAGFAAVEAKDELIELGLQMLTTQPVVDASRPSLQVGKDLVNPRQDEVSGGLADDMDIVAIGGDRSVAGPAVGFRDGFGIGGTLVAVSTSGGKDSQAMTILLSRIVPRDRLVAVHAPLGEVEWPNTVEFIRATLPPGMALILAPVASGKTLLDSIEERGRFPSPKVGWCTSSLKRGPIERELRRYLKANPRFGGRIVSAMGMRAEESPARARKPPWRLNERNFRAGRTWFDWLPTFDLTEREVFRAIRDAGQSPHPAYAMGMSSSPVSSASWPRAPICCSARGLRADRRDKLLKLLDTRGQNCTPNNKQRADSRSRGTHSFAAEPTSERATGQYPDRRTRFLRRTGRTPNWPRARARFGSPALFTEGVTCITV